MAKQYWGNEGSTQEVDDRLNPYEMERRAAGDGSHDNIDGYNRNADGLDDHPVSVGVADGEESFREGNSSNLDFARNKETNPSVNSGWLNNTNSNGNTSGPKSKLFAQIAKKGPAGMLLGGGLGLTAIAGLLGAPGLYLVHFTETLTQRFNFQQVAMNNSNNRVMASKLSDKTKGFCGNTITVRCKFSSFSERELKNLEKQGIKAVGNDIRGVTGRSRPTHFEFTDTNGTVKKYNARDFHQEMRKPGSNLRTSALTAYNPGLGGYADKVFTKVKGKLKISKNRPFSDSDNTKEKRNKKLIAIAESGDGDRGRIGRGSAANCEGEECNDKQKVEKEKSPHLDEINEEAEKVKESGRKVGGFGARVRAGVGLLGVADAACSILQVFHTVETASKTIRVLQLARYAFTFMTVASMIKAGEATEEDVTYLATILTTTMVMEKVIDGKKTKIETKAGTDSFGFRNAAFGDKGITESAMNFSAGGSFVGELGDLKNKAVAAVGGKRNAKKTCNIVQNPFIQAGSLVAGGLTSLLPGAGWIKLGVQVAAMGAITEIASRLLMPMLINTAAGVVVDDMTHGELAADAFTVGQQKTASDVAIAGYNAPLSPDQAAKNSVAMEKVAYENMMYERDTKSPFDAYSQHTMVGSLVSGLLPYTAKIRADSSNILSVSASLLSSSMSNIISPKAKAVNGVTETADDYTSLDDDYKDGGIASTRQSIPVVGLPEEVLSIDPDEAYRRLVSHQKEWCANRVMGNCVEPRTDPDPHIDWKTGEPLSIKYKKFVEHCVDRETPYNDMEGADNWVGEKESKGVNDCKITSENYPTKLPDDQGPGEPEKDPDGVMGTGAANKDDVLTTQERKDFYAWGNHMRTLTNLEEGYPEPSKPTGGGSSSQQSSSAMPEECNSMADDDPGQIACHAYQFDNYGYLWGGGHGPSAKDWMDGFKAGKYKEGQTAILDCSGLVRMAIYSATGKDPGAMVSGTPTNSSKWKKISHEEAKAGDVIVKPGHIEIIVSNDTSAKKFNTFGAHSARVAFPKQIGPSSYSYSSVSAYRYQG